MENFSAPFSRMFFVYFSDLRCHFTEEFIERKEIIEIAALVKTLK
jgi:hypothetical protein